MNENVENVNLEEAPIVSEYEPNEFSDDFFENQDMELADNVEENWHNDDNVLYNVNDEQNNAEFKTEENNEEPIITTNEPIFGEENNIETIEMNGDIVPATVEEPAENEENNELTSFEPDKTNENEFVSIDNGNEKTENFDAYFDSLYDDVEGANNLITEIIEKKKSLQESEEGISQIKNELAKEKEDFENFMNSQKEDLELEKKQFDELVKTQKARLQEEEDQIKSEADVKNRELDLKEQSIKIEQEKLNSDKDQFIKYKETEESKIESEREKLENQRLQLDKDTKLSLQTIENEKKDFEKEKEHFEQSKVAEEKKIAFEKENLAQSCTRFKQLVSQFNNNFSKLPEDK